MDRKKNGKITKSVETSQQLFILFQLYNCSIQNIQAPQSFKTDLTKSEMFTRIVRNFILIKFICYDAFR